MPTIPIKIWQCGYDDFIGIQIGEYKTMEGKEGVVLQQLGTRVVHVYRLDRLIQVEDKSP